MILRSAHSGDLAAVAALMRPFVARGQLLPRAAEELQRLLPHAFLAEHDGRPVGFAALEVYGRKLSEIQCLSFEEGPLSAEIVRRLARQCVDRARDLGVMEVLAVVASPLEETLVAEGFHLALPDQKKAMFVRTAGHGKDLSGDARLQGLLIRDARPADAPQVAEFLKPFVARKELLPRSLEDVGHLLRHAFVVEDRGRLVGFAAVELYSPKLSELQCLSVDESYRGRRIGRQLVSLCVRRAREHDVEEVMAITAREEVLRACGFDYGLPGPETALFIQTRPRDAV